MRYCPNCRRINEGWPERCRFCGLTWRVRICRRGHPNPPNSVFCGECGSGDLTEVARGGWFLNALFGAFQGGGASSFLKLLLKLALPILLLIALLPLFSTLLPLVFVVAVLFGVFRHSLRLLPSWITGRAGRYIRNSFRDYKDRAGRRDSRGE